MIVCIYKKLIKNTALRILFAIVLLIVSISLITFSFLIKPDIENPIYNNKNHYPEIKRDAKKRIEIKQGEADKPQNNEIQTLPQHTQKPHPDIPSNIEVTGSMTLIEVSRKYQVPLDHLKKALNISISTSDNERLGRLRRTKGFTMSEVEKIIYTYQKQNK